MTEVYREISPVDWSDLRPEPRERFLFVSGVLLLPFVLLGSYLGLRRLMGTRFGSRLAGRIAPAVAWLAAIVVPVLVLSAVAAEDREQMRVYLPGGAVSVIVAVLLAVALSTVADRFRGKGSRSLTAALVGLTGVLLLGILLFSVTGPEHIRNIPIFNASFNAIFYSVVQVCLGRALLIDFVNQYGLYPHFIEPVLRLAGLGVYSFTALMGLLSCLAYACFYRFLARETDDEILAFLGLATMVFFGYVAGRVVEPDLYLQYQPLRIIFPAFAVLLAGSFARRPTPARAVGLAALGAVALLWNTDTGVVLLVAGLLLPAYDSLLRRRTREVPVRLLLGIAAATGIFGVFTLYMRLRYGGFPDWQQLLAPSKPFYLYGANMLPMPHYGLWVPVLIIYAAALLLAVAALAEGEDTPRARLYFFLPVFGLGIFTYYQGRSVLASLMMAGYPALLLLALFADDLRRRRPRAGTADRILAGSLLFLLVLSVPSLATVAPDWYRNIAAKARVTLQGPTDVMMNDATFLQRYFRPGDKVLIASYASGFYHALTRTTNPLDIPGDSEIIYRRDCDKQNLYLETLPGPAVIDKSALPNLVERFLRRYPASMENPNGNLIILRRSP